MPINYGTLEQLEKVGMRLNPLEIAMLKACHNQKNETDSNEYIVVNDLQFTRKEDYSEEALRDALWTLWQYGLIDSINSDKSFSYPYIQGITTLGEFCLRDLIFREEERKCSGNEVIPNVTNYYNITGSFATFGDKSPINIENNISDSFNNLKALLTEDDMAIFEEMKAEANSSHPSIDTILEKAKRFVTNNKDVIAAVIQIVASIIPKILT